MQKSKSLTERVDARLQVLGFHDPAKPKLSEDDLEVPRCGITEAPTELLGTLYSNYGTLVNYVSGVVGTLDVDRIQAEHAYHEAKAEAMGRVRRDPSLRKASVTEKKAFAEDQPAVLEARREMAEKEAIAKKGQRLLDGYKTLWMSLSREISRRAGSYSPQQGGGTFGNTPHHNGTLRSQENLRRNASGYRKG